MKKAATVLVLGAGASCPYGLPSAYDLNVHLIRELENRRSPLVTSLRECDHSEKDVDEFGRALRRSKRASVDAFLELRPEFLTIGKRAIAASLMAREEPVNLSSSDPDEDWLEYLCNILLTPRGFEGCQLRIVTFNYDRSVEQFLFEMLSAALPGGPAGAVKALACVPVVHVHGSLGAMPWEQQSTGRLTEAEPFVRPYSTRFGVPDVLAAAERIKIVHESDAQQDPDFIRAREWIRGSANILFLGFSYHRSNMTRLGFPWSPQFPMLGSAYRLSPGEQESARNAAGGALSLQGLTCRAFLRQHPLRDW